MIFFENKIEKIKKSISAKVVPSMLFHIYLLLKRGTHLGFNAIKMLKETIWMLHYLLLHQLMLYYINIALFYVALLILDYFNVPLLDVAPFDAAKFIVALLDFVLF